MKPNFFVIGAPKAATTTLCDLLGRHPEVYMWPLKETHFFDMRYDRGYEWYESLFNATNQEIAIGEGTPAYTIGKRKTPWIAKEMHKYCPEARLIYLVRHPIERLGSHYLEMLADGHSFQSLSDALHNDSPLIETSKYWDRLNEYRQYFPDRNILVLFFEDFIKNPHHTVKKCFELLDVDPDFNVGEVTAKNTKEEKLTDRFFMKWLRKQPYYLTLQRRLVPRWVVNNLKSRFRKPLKADFTWEKHKLEWATEYVIDDSRKILNFCGKPEDYWKFELLK